MINNKDITLGLNETGKPLLVTKKNTLVVAPLGSGLLPYITTPVLLEDMKNKDIGIIVFDCIQFVGQTAYALAELHGRKAIYFNGASKNFKFNPLKGEEERVINGIIQMVRDFLYDKPSRILSELDTLIANAIKILNEVNYRNITMQELYRFIGNIESFGEIMFNEYLKRKVVENVDVAFLKEYFQNNSELFNECFCIQSLFENIVANPYLDYLFNTKEESEFVEFDFKSAIENNEVIIVNVPFGIIRNEAKILASLLANSYTNMTLKENKNKEIHVFIPHLNAWQSGFNDLFSISERKNLTIMADVQSLSYLRNQGFNDYSLLTKFNNFVFFPQIKDSDETFLLESQLLSEKDINVISSLEYPKFFVCVETTDNSIIQKGICEAKGIGSQNNELIDSLFVKKSFQEKIFPFMV